MKRIALAGSQDLAQLIAYHLAEDSEAEVAGFFDDFRSPGEATAHGPVLGKISEMPDFFSRGEFDAFMCGIGYKHMAFRKRVFEQLHKLIPAFSLVHSSSVVDPSCSVGAGSLILPGCVLDAGCEVSENVVLNTGVTVAHDSSVAAHSFLGPGVCLAGFVRVGSECFIGVGTTVIDSISIASGVQTGGGAVVVSDLEERAVYLGVPAKLHRRTEEGE